METFQSFRRFFTGNCQDLWNSDSFRFFMDNFWRMWYEIKGLEGEKSYIGKKDLKVQLEMNTGKNKNWRKIKWK